MNDELVQASRLAPCTGELFRETLIHWCPPPEGSVHRRRLSLQTTTSREIW